MGDLVINWQGISGKTYTFHGFSLNTKFNPADGNYIFAKQTQTGYDAIYIGQGDLPTRIANHLNEGCVIRKGATIIFAHLNSLPDSRRREEEDLLGYNIEAYEPTGCNKKKGG